MHKEYFPCIQHNGINTEIDTQTDAYTILKQDFEKKHELFQLKNRTENDSDLQPEQRTELLEHLQIMQDITRHRLIVQLHKAGERTAIEEILGDTFSTRYQPEQGYYRNNNLRRISLN